MNSFRNLCSVAEPEIPEEDLLLRSMFEVIQGLLRVTDGKISVCQMF